MRRQKRLKGHAFAFLRVGPFLDIFWVWYISWSGYEIKNYALSNKVNVKIHEIILHPLEILYLGQGQFDMPQSCKYTTWQWLEINSMQEDVIAHFEFCKCGNCLQKKHNFIGNKTCQILFFFAWGERVMVATCSSSYKTELIKCVIIIIYTLDRRIDIGMQLDNVW